MLASVTAAVARARPMREIVKAIFYVPRGPKRDTGATNRADHVGGK